MKVLDRPVAAGSPGSGAPEPPAPVTPPTRRVPRLRFIAAALGLTAVAVGLFLWWRTPAAVTYVTANIDRGDIDATVNASGNLNAVITVQVGSQVSGNILAISRST